MIGTIINTVGILVGGTAQILSASRCILSVHIV